ncbi:Soluble aldose sugar dehydrogenase YliI precursor [Marinomonas gallaica]|uniref:Soluble aldose sugar dehydrogenase YliI n=1 Tax=Marinomonas gallaica TaxID=1806667 RepID=A0A1C3JV62_9GAMM|nr:PQQ-dependent sugar dehydrogenase [Marinomonas gallaica]SBT19108.1 Soluble aldose sugar dehydrogenase YliI precursor [Marinomonas gallaica]SBT20817.1 Soluble aldose sugar dehydrogenase YliI precursor [Marinomonas gallaica]
MLQLIKKMSVSLLMTVSILGHAVEAEPQFQIEKISQLQGIPWGMAQLNTDTLLVTILDGQLLKVDILTGETVELSGLPEIARFGQGGLLDVAIPPDFKDTGWVYFTYAHPTTSDEATTALARAKLLDNALVEWTDLVIADASSSKGQHFGSRIAFDGQGHVFFSVGDRGKRANAQDLSNHAGSILRVNMDGTVPADNPYVRHGQIRPEIWSFGHRNPQGLYFDQKTQHLWSNEHGPRGGDEINLIRVGANYGWPIVSYGKEYWAPIQVGESTSKEGVEEPKKVFIPSIAPSSLLIYRGDLFKEWNGDFLSTALALRHLNNVKLKSGKVYETRFLEDLKERLRDVIEASDGSLLISTDSGKILQLFPAHY